jgi:hypothetical protein
MTMTVRGRAALPGQVVVTVQSDCATRVLMLTRSEKDDVPRDSGSVWQKRMYMQLVVQPQKF